MADAQGIKAGRAYVELGANRGPFDKALNDAARKLRSWGAAIGGIGASITTPLVALGGIFANRSRELLRISEETGLTVESLTSLGFAAERTGGSMEDVESAAMRMNNFIGQVASGSHEAAQMLDRLGLSLADLNGLSTGDQMRLLFDRIHRVGNAAEQTFAARGIFGRGIGGLLPLIHQGADGLRDLERAARMRGRVITTEEAEQGREFFRELTAIAGALKTAAMLIGGGLVPGLRAAFAADKDIASMIVYSARATANWLRQNSALIASVFRLGLGLTVAGGVLYGIGVGLPMIARALGIITLAQWAFNAATAANPYVAGALIGILAGLAASILLWHALGVLPGMMQAANSGFRTLTEDMTTSWQAVVDAVAAGDLELAFSVTKTTLALEWARLMELLTTGWQGFLVSFQIIMLRIETGWMLMWARISNWTEAGFEAQRAAINAGNDQAERKLRVAGAMEIGAAHREVLNHEIDLRNMAEEASIRRGQAQARAAAGLPEAGQQLLGGVGGAGFGTFSAQEALGQAADRGPDRIVEAVQAAERRIREVVAAVMQIPRGVMTN